MSDRRIVVDFELCESNGVCMGVAPEVFRLDDDGVLHVLEESPPQALWARVEQAAASCPRFAIAITFE
jgi:ferredoxin